MRRLDMRKKTESKTTQRLVPEKYKIRFGDAQVDLEEGVDSSVHTQPNTMLLKEPGLYCLPHKVRRLSKQLSNQQKEIEEKDAALALLTDGLQGRDNQIQAIQYENMA